MTPSSIAHYITELFFSRSSLKTLAETRILVRPKTASCTNYTGAQKLCLI
jgi:hypothetical protein